MKLFTKNKSSVKPRTVVIDSLKYKSDSIILPFIFQTLLLCVTLVGFLLSVSTSVDMPINAFAIIGISVPMIIASMLLTLNKYTFIGYSGVFGLAVLLVFTLFKGLREKIIDSFTFCFNLTIQRMVDQGYTNYESAMTEDISELLDDSAYMNECFYTVIIVLAIVFSFIFSLTLVKRAFVIFAVLPCFLVLTPSLYFGSTPDSIAFSIFISGILGCYIESMASFIRKRKGKSEDREAKASKKSKKKSSAMGRSFHTSSSGFASMCVSLALSLTVSLSLFSSDGMQIESIREAIDKLANKVMNSLFYENYETSAGAIGGLLEGDTLDLRTPEFRDLPVMTVTTKTNSSLYLRGWIGVNLEGDGWKILNENDTQNFVNAVGTAFDENTQFYNYTKIVSPTELADAKTSYDTGKLGFAYDTVDVKAKYSKSKMVFTPVKCLDGKINAKHDGLITIGDTVTFFENGRSEGNKYSYNAALQTFADRDFYLSFHSKQNNYLSYAESVLKKTGTLTESEQFIYNERKYAEYVKATYLTVPEKSDTLYQIALAETASYDKKLAKALAIERYFKTNYSYAQKFPQVIGDAMDKINYMVKESKIGYCTYYATAMTIMMRQLGMPARYVNGYHAMIEPEDGKNEYVRQINDDNYHAWVEVYFDGIGWLSFDPTPGMSSTISVRDYDYLDDAEWEDEQPDTPSDGNEYIPPLISAPVTPVAPEESEITDIIGSDDEEERKYDYDDALPKWVLQLIIAVIIIAAIVGLLLLIAFLIRFRHRSYIASLHNIAPKNLVCTVYPDILRLLSARKYRPKSGEMMKSFVSRVDKEIVLPITFKSIQKTLEMSQFSVNEIDFKSASRVFEYYNNLSDYIFHGMNVVKKYYYMLTLKKRKY